MKDVMVSIRMPKGLVEEIASISQEDHFLDLSETIRSITRQKWLTSEQPELSALKEIGKGITDEVTQLTKKRVTQEVVDELKKIRDQIKKGGLHG